MSKPHDIARLREIARQARIDVIKMLTAAGSGHPGGSSEIEIITALFGHVMRHDPQNPQWDDRDRFVLSKGHGIPGLYAVQAAMGYCPRTDLMTLRQIDSPYQGHPDRCRLPFMEASTGSLGQGLSIAVGEALASRLDGDRFRVYCLIGDGESQEGQIWEAALCASKYKLDNMVCILDYNKAQIDGFVHEVMPLEPIADKWAAFGWHVIPVDGHDIDALIVALEEAKTVKGKPTFLLADTVKGKGVSFMEGKVDWHGVAPNAEQARAALEELGV